MFLQLYRANKGDKFYQEAKPYLESDPVKVAFLMDKVWYYRNEVFFSPLSSFPFYPNNEPSYLSLTPNVWVPNDDTNNLWLNHLIYAYMIENTRVYEIFEKIIFEYLYGEKLGFPARPETVKWLRTTEELFYKSSSNYLIQSVVSNIRPDIRSSRRNAYYRMFGLDLNHGTGSTSSYPYHRPAAANKEFVPLFEELLSEVWIGMTYITSLGPSFLDKPKIADLIRRIKELLATRRQAGNLAREEFYHVATMSWMHLTLHVDDAPVVKDMAINAESPAERLRQMGERVGYPAHPRADAFFQMAEDISGILVLIEHGIDGNPVEPELFYAPGQSLRKPMENVITQWSIATGKDIKALKSRPASIGLPEGRVVGAVALAAR